MSIEQVDVLVIGAGPGGTVAASMVKQSGLNVRIIEKQQFPRFVIGESLLPKCMEHFEEAGFLDALKRQGFEKKCGARFLKGDKACSFDFSEQFTKGWEWTWQLPRADMDVVLAEEAIKMGITIDFETTVTGIDFRGRDSLTTVENKAGVKKQIDAKFVIDASGYGRVIPRLFNLDVASDLTPKKSIFTHVIDEKRTAGSEGTQITFVVHKQQVWIWVIPFSNSNTSLGVVGPPEFFDVYKGSAEQVLREIIDTDPHYRDRFFGVQYQFEPKIIDGYSTSVKKLWGDGFVLVGNSAEFLDPVFSSGVTFATESGLLAGKLASRHVKGGQVDWGQEYTDYIMEGVDVFRSYVNAWYDGSLQDIFFAENINSDINDQICSVLAGYVWDKNNPFVKKHEQALKSLTRVVSLSKQTV